jgi:IS4 transposase
VWLLTNLSADKLPSGRVRELYRHRWLIELFSKRMTSTPACRGELATRDGPTARSG